MVDFKKALVDMNRRDANVKGSSFDPARDGISQNVLYTFLECRQKARLYLQGWTTKAPSMALTYGSIVHSVLECAYTDIQDGVLRSLPDKSRVDRYTQKIEKEWRKENSQADKKALEFLELSLLVAEATMPIYFEYWNKDIKELPWKKIEQQFNIKYTLPDGRSTFFHGMMDGVYGRKDTWLFETKTKSQINEGNLMDMLPFELQINIYLWVLRHSGKGDIVPSGVLYNIIRRIQLEQRKKETIQAFSKRCIEDIRERPDFYFKRIEIVVTKQDMNRFDMELEDMVRDFYDWWQGKSGHYKNPGACINKYGRCKYLTACSTGKLNTYVQRKKIEFGLEETT